MRSIGLALLAFMAHTAASSSAATSAEPDTPDGNEEGSAAAGDKRGPPPGPPPLPTKKKRSTQHCSHCKEPGHRISTCPTWRADGVADVGAAKAVVLSRAAPKKSRKGGGQRKANPKRARCTLEQLEDPDVARSLKSKMEFAVPQEWGEDHWFHLFDMETSGLSRTNSHVLSVSCIMFQKKIMPAMRELLLAGNALTSEEVTGAGAHLHSQDILPWKGFDPTWSKRAHKAHQISKDRLAKASGPRTVWPGWRDFVHATSNGAAVTLLGQNSYSFDVPFLAVALKKSRVDWQVTFVSCLHFACTARTAHACDVCCAR